MRAYAVLLASLEYPDLVHWWEQFEQDEPLASAHFLSSAMTLAEDGSIPPPLLRDTMDRLEAWRQRQQLSRVLSAGRLGMLSGAVARVVRQQRIMENEPRSMNPELDSPTADASLEEKS